MLRSHDAVLCKTFVARKNGVIFTGIEFLRVLLNSAADGRANKTIAITKLSTGKGTSSLIMLVKMLLLKFHHEICWVKLVFHSTSKS